MGSEIVPEMSTEIISNAFKGRITNIKRKMISCISDYDLED